MKLIELTKGYFAKVDDWRFEELSKHSWCVTTWKGKIYARRRKPGPVKDGCPDIRMHRQVMGVTDPKIEVDHIDGDTLNCQEGNLRASTRSQNACNRGVDKRSKTGYKGVSAVAGTKKWRAYIVKDCKQKSLGWHDCPIKAARAYDTAATELHGEFANLNFP